MFKNTSSHDWLLGNTRNKETIRLAAKSISDYGKYFAREAGKYEFKCINTEDCFLGKQIEALKYLVKQVIPEATLPKGQNSSQEHVD